MKRFNKISAGVCSLIAMAAIPASSYGVVIYDAAGFETPRFSTTISPYAPSAPNLQGQDNIVGGGQGPWVVDQPPSVQASAIIQTAIVASGSQAVQMTRGVGKIDTRYGVYKPVPDVSLTIPEITIQWDMRVENPAPLPGGAIAAPFFGVEANDSLDNVTNDETGSNVLVIGLLGVDANTRAVTYQDANGELQSTASFVNYGQWNTYKMVLNYNADTYSIYLNGGLLLSNLPFVDDGSPGNPTGVTEIDDFTDAPLATLAMNQAAFSTSAGTAYYDNYIIVPEPSMAVGGLVMAGLTGLSRKRCSAH